MEEKQDYINESLKLTDEVSKIIKYNLYDEQAKQIYGTYLIFLG
ncbi:hypothetical protein ACWOFR_14685 [Carnobacterium gallinarum]|nr:hypothetical protein [Carnobacterium gallinarum]